VPLAEAPERVRERDQPAMAGPQQIEVGELRVEG
jgi:hypothetical protein